MDAPTVRQVAAKWFAASSPRTVVVVGDRATMTDAVSALGLPTTWTDPSSAILGTFEAAGGQQ